MDSTALMEQRQAKDQFFATGHHSPIDPLARASFGGLRYFEPSEELVFTLEIEESDGGEVTVETSDGSQRVYTRAGMVAFEIDGRAAQLTLYATAQPGFFVPFRDATSGVTTYGAGRYLDIEPNAEGTVTLDFNLAYNPYCAYNDAYSCPLPPFDNWLQVPVEAGEMDFVRGEPEDAG